MFKRRKVMIDADWLLGKRPAANQRWQNMRAIAFAFSLMVIAVLSVPYISRAWLKENLELQFFQATDPADQELAMIALAEMLPDSTETIVRSLSHQDSIAAKLAYDALDLHISRLNHLPRESRHKNYAYILGAMESSFEVPTSHAASYLNALVTRIRASLVSDSTMMSTALIASCDSVASRTTSIPANLQRQNNEAIAANANLSQAVVTTALDSTAQHTQLHSLDTVTIDLPRSSHRLDDASLHPSLHPSLRSRVDATKDARSDTDVERTHENVIADQSSLESNKWKAVTDSNDLRIAETPKSIPVSTASLVTRPVERAKMTTHQKSAEQGLEIASTANSGRQRSANAPSASSTSAVIGIERQRTDDLVTLLGSVRENVASAALYEMERRGLSADQIDIAIDVARGDIELKLKAADRILQQQDFEPSPWLGLLATDKDQRVRTRAISLLGSLNSVAARTKLRLLLARERDPEITKRIQQILLTTSQGSGGSTFIDTSTD